MRMSSVGGSSPTAIGRKRRRFGQRRPAVKSPGTYALVLFLPRTRMIQVGALGTIRFPRGVYIYVGSAMSGLDARIARHRRRADKKLFWHIDYVLQHARVLDVWTCPGGRRWECAWAQAVLALPNARVVAPCLGASDCRCRAHLIHLAAG